MKKKVVDVIKNHKTEVLICVAGGVIGGVIVLFSVFFRKIPIFYI